MRLSDQSAFGGTENPQVAVVDLDTVAIYGVEGDRFLRLSTSDGGVRWQVTATDLPRGGYRVTSVSQPSKKDAWVVLSGPASETGGETLMYHVTDAGARASLVRVAIADPDLALRPAPKPKWPSRTCATGTSMPRSLTESS